MVATPVAAPTGMPENLATELANATPEAPSTPEILVGTPAPEAPKPAPSLEPAGPEGLAAPTEVKTEPIQNQAASDTMALPGQASQDDVQAAMNEILGVTTPAPAAEPAKPETPSGLPQIVSQGSVMAQNVAEPLPETPDYGAMIDEALTEATTAPINPAVKAAPAVPASTPDANSLPNLQFDANATPVAMMEPTPAPAAPAAPAETPAAAPVAPATPAAPEAPVKPVEVPADTDIELPPPPAPNIDMSAPAMPPAVATAPEPAPAAPETPAVPEALAAPAAEPAAPAADPSAFQIPKA